MKLLRKILVGLLALVLVAVVALYAVSEWKLRSAPKPAMASLARPTPAQLADAPRQLHVLGCLSCHGDRLQGDAFLDDPKIARLYAPNLTLIAARATDQQLDHAIRQGIGHDGRPLLVMPSEGYQVLTDQEAAAIIAAIRTYPKTGTESPARSIGPLGRLGIVLGKFRTVPSLVADYKASPAADYGPQFAAGRHIVEANCTECHGTSLRGQEVEPGVVSADLSIVGAYDLDQFKRLLREGVAPSGKDIGLMGRIARSDFKHMTDEEIAAVHAYLVENAQRAH
jgi:mono/diheme cytochrome c family protein